MEYLTEYTKLLVQFLEVITLLNTKKVYFWNDTMEWKE